MLQPIQVLDLIIILAAVLVAAWLFSHYLTKVFTKSPSRLDRILDPIENLIYRISGIDRNHSMGWKEYLLSGLYLNIIQMIIAFIILVFQERLPLNPQGFPGVPVGLAFNTVVSFATNTNLQHYNGAQTLSYFSQMTAIQFLQFSSAATGICFGIAMVRGFIQGSTNMGNFFVDFVRSLTRIFIPLSLIASVVFVWLGVPQTLGGYITVRTIEGSTQTILAGPVASLVSIMQIGTNGGGYFGANSAYPFQNPNPGSDVLEIFLMLLIPTALCFAFGHFIKKKRQSIPLVIGAYSLLALYLLIAFIPNPVLVGPGIETRSGGFMSTLWTVVTTAATTGSLNSALAGMHPLVILSAFFGMFVQGSPGSNGVGLMYLIMYVVITVFIVGLMSGRSPEYLGMKITAKDVKLVMIAFLIHPLIIIVPTVLTYASGAARAIGIGTNAVGFTQLLYEFTSAAANNGSDFLGAAANTPFFNISTSLIILIGRYAPVACLLALGGSMIGRKRSETDATLRTDSLTFSLVLVASILVLVVLTFFPFLALGPILAYFQGSANFFG